MKKWLLMVGALLLTACNSGVDNKSYYQLPVATHSGGQSTASQGNRQRHDDSAPEGHGLGAEPAGDLGDQRAGVEIDPGLARPVAQRAAGLEEGRGALLGRRFRARAGRRSLCSKRGIATDRRTGGGGKKTRRSPDG